MNHEQSQKVWMVTGAGRGLGVEIVRAALEAGHAVVATGRDPQKMATTLGRHGRMLTVRLDITKPDEAQAAVQASVERFGRLDVLVNNAGDFHAGFFEEMRDEQVRRQMETLLFGPMNVTRAALPVMRGQRSGLLMSISSTAGLVGGTFASAYAAGKFALEGWMESLAPEVAPFGIKTMLVEPGFFRTELLTPDSSTYAEPSIDDYAQKTRTTIAGWQAMNGQQGGDPAKLAQALVGLAALQEPPFRFVAGTDAVEAFKQKGRLLLEQAEASPDLSCNLALAQG